MSETIGIVVTGAGDGASKISETTETGIPVSTNAVSLPPKSSESTVTKSSIVLSVSKSVKAKPSPSTRTTQQRKVSQKSAHALQTLGASKADVWKDTKQVRKDIARQRTSTGDPIEEGLVASEVASDLLSEIKGTEFEKIARVAEDETPTYTRSTMKIFLQGSSRMQIPFSENNAFCHLYPHNKLCGAGI